MKKLYPLLSVLFLWGCEGYISKLEKKNISLVMEFI